MSDLKVFAVAAAVILAAANFATPAQADESCADNGPTKSKEAITKNLQDHGYTQIRSLSTHSGCYETKGIDSKGNHFGLEVNGATREVVTAE